VNTSNVFRILAIALVASLVVGDCVIAEIPKQSKDDLLASASHMVTGSIQRTYERKETLGDFEFTHGVAEVAVEKVAKGSDIATDDRIYVRYWSKKWIGSGNPPPDHYGHWNIPRKSDSAEIYVKGNRKTGFDVQSPNGFFQVTSAKNAKVK